MYKTLRLPHKEYIICCPLLIHSFATQKQITVTICPVNYGQLKSPYRASLLYWLSFTHYLHPQLSNFNYPCFWCETACPLKRVLFNFLSEQEVRKTEPSSCLPLFSLQNSKLSPLFSQLPPSIPSLFLFPLCKWQGGRSRGQVGQSPPPPPTFCLHVLLFV